MRESFSLDAELWKKSVRNAEIFSLDAELGLGFVGAGEDSVKIGRA